jgi:resuscitation-promoting factor RpfA
MSQDREFEKYLEGKSVVSQLYAEVPQVELPKHLDAAILAEAHRAVNSRPGAKPKRRWAIPLGMVATLFVAVMIGLQLPYILQDAASPRQYKEEKIAAMMDTGIAERSAVTAEERKKVQEPNRVMPNAKSDLKRGEPVPLAAEAEAPAKLIMPVRKAPNEPAGIAESTIAPVAGAAQPAAKSMGIMQRFPVAESSQLGGTAVVASPAVVAPAPAAAAKRFGLNESGDIAKGSVLSKEKKTSVQTTDKQNDSFEQHAPAAAGLASPQPARSDGALKDEVSEKELTPEEWLIRIKMLKRQGNVEEVKKELAAFKKRYPEFVVPKDLEGR